MLFSSCLKEEKDFMSWERRISTRESSQCYPSLSHKSTCRDEKKSSNEFCRLTLNWRGGPEQRRGGSGRRGEESGRGRWASYRTYYSSLEITVSVGGSDYYGVILLKCKSSLFPGSLITRLNIIFTKKTRTVWIYSLSLFLSLSRAYVRTCALPRF